MSGKNEFIRGKPADMHGEQLLRLLFKSVTIFIIIIGLQISAQRFASGLSFDPAWVGQPLFELSLFGRSFFIYPFWNLFSWSVLFFRVTVVHDLLWASWQITLYASILAIAFYFVMEFMVVRQRKQNIFGSARWATKEDLVQAGLLQGKGGVVLGQLSDAKVNVKYDNTKDSVIMSLKKPSQKLIQAGIYNTVLSAPTRSGKGVSTGIPTLLTYPNSVIVLDFKGENYDYSAGFRSKFGKVYRFEPTGDKGHQFNPLWEIRPGEDAYSDANLIADILTTPASGGGNSNSEHFQVAAKAFLTGVILHCLTSSKWQDKSLSGCRSFITQTNPEDPEDSKFIYNEMINDPGKHGDPLIHQSIVEAANTQAGRGPNEGASVLSTVNNALAVFADLKVKRNTTVSEFYIDEFEKTDVPISLYLTIQYSDVQRIAALLRMFVTLFSRRFTSGETSATKRKFNIPLLFILDEFDKLGRMDELEMNMGIHNGFGIHYLLIFQSLNQLNKIYTKDHAFLAHCRNSIFYAPGSGEYESAEIISKICGKESISKANVSYSGTRGAMGYNNASLSSQDQERNLINPDEIIKLPLDRFLLLCQGKPPYIGTKNVYYEDPIFKNRISPPPFKTREEAVKQAKSTIEYINNNLWFLKNNQVKHEPEVKAPPVENNIPAQQEGTDEQLDETQGFYEEGDEASGGKEDNHKPHRLVESR